PAERAQTLSDADQARAGRRLRSPRRAATPPRTGPPTQPLPRSDAHQDDSVYRFAIPLGGLLHGAQRPRLRAPGRETGSPTSSSWPTCASTRWSSRPAEPAGPAGDPCWTQALASFAATTASSQSQLRNASVASCNRTGSRFGAWVSPPIQTNATAVNASTPQTAGQAVVHRDRDEAQQIILEVVEPGLFRRHLLRESPDSGRVVDERPGGDEQAE